MNEATDNGVYSMTAMARRLGISPATLKRLTEAGKLPCWFQDDSGRYVYSDETIREHQRLAARRGAVEATL